MNRMSWLTVYNLFKMTTVWVKTPKYKLLGVVSMTASSTVDSPKCLLGVSLSFKQITPLTVVFCHIRSSFAIHLKSFWSDQPVFRFFSAERRAFPFLFTPLDISPKGFYGTR